MTSSPIGVPQIIVGSVFTPPEDPLPRLLVTRHWPRGVPKGAVDQWEPHLGPAPEIAAALSSGIMTRDAFEAAYRAQVLERPHLLDWAGRMATNTGVALLCESHDDAICHRTLLAAILRERLSLLSQHQEGPPADER
jgi:uncharacterized protein YeaO (DUF488 family)